MLKNVVIITLVMLLCFQGAVFAAESRGEIIVKDGVYGAMIGMVLGFSVWLIDADRSGDKLLTAFGIGLTTGTLAGLAYGVAVDSKSFVSIEKNEMKFALPTPKLERTQEDWKLRADLLKVEF